MPKKVKEPKSPSQPELHYATPRNPSQEKLFNSLNNKSCKIIIASGPAGTGKTLFSVEHGIKGFLNGRYKKIRVVKFKRRKNYMKTHGHKQGFTEEKIESIK